MDTLVNVAHGFGVALLPINLLYCFIGVFIGTLVGVLPGIGPISAMSLLLPVTLSGTPESGIIMMAGIYYGSMYGGSTTSILVNIPGEAASVVTCIDGHQMAKQGRAGPALGISAFGSFIAGTFSLVALMLVAPRLAGIAIAFGPAEYFSLMVLGLVVLTFLTQGSMPKALLMACTGVVLGLIGLDSITAQPRLTFGRMELIDGIGLVPVVMGLFGVAEVLLNIEQAIKRDIINARITQLLPTKADWQASAGPVARGTVLGFLLGILPGGGAVVASFASYALEKRLSKTPERFGHGAIEGVAGPESANNAAAGGAFIPLMTLGIPPNVVMALLLGAFVIHGLQPGPLLITQNPRPVLGHRRQHVYRQRHVADPQSTDDRHVGAAAQAALQHSLPPDHPVHDHRRVLLEQQRVRRLCDDRIRYHRLFHAQARLRAGPAGARLRARTDAGEQSAQVADPVAGRPLDLCAAADLGGVSRTGAGAAGRAAVAGAAQKARAGGAG
ncbi:putative tricarboxylic transport membrane protein [Bradyrhizobium sp. LM2.9]